MDRLRTALLLLLSLAYPLLVYLAMGRFEPRWLALFLVVLAVLRAAATRQPLWLAMAAGAGMLAILAAVSGQALPLKLYPVLVNAALLAVFATSLRFPPTVVERIARIGDPQLPAHAVAYTRRVTQVWCVFFVANGLLALATAVWATPRIWALYNGGLAYLMMGILFVGEWCVRQRVKVARHE